MGRGLPSLEQTSVVGCRQAQPIYHPAETYRFPRFRFKWQFCGVHLYANDSTLLAKTRKYSR